MTATLDERLGLNEAFDATAKATQANKGERYVMLGFFAAAVSPLVGVTAALAWVLAMSAAEAWVSWLTAPERIARRPGSARIQRMLATAAVGVCWSVLGILLWRVGDPPARLASYALLSVVMLYAIRVCYRSRAHLISALLPAVTTLLLLPFSYLGAWRDFIITETASLVLTAYAARSAVSVLRAHVQLQATLRELVGEREAAQAASQAKSDFLATISHEIRTPLNGVLGMAQAIGEEDLPPAQHERLAVLQDSGRAVLSLLNDLLDLSRIEAGRLDLEEAPFDLAVLARSLHASFEPVCAARGVALSVEVDPSADGQWLGDEPRIRQLVSNLLANSAKYTAKGAVSCRFHYEEPFLIVDVRDTGVGIAPELLPYLFELYAKGGAAGLRETAGLGLPVVRQLAELMNGDVRVESEPGHGAVFTVRLPLAPGSAVADNAALRRTDAIGLRVLSADDHAVDRLVLTTLLGKAGLDVTVVENAPLLISIWEHADVDVILLDIEMPLMNGLEAARRIRAKEAELGRRPTPIVALTGNVMSQYVADYRAAGMDAVVAKPIEAATLLRTIAEVVANAGVQPLERREA